MPSALISARELGFPWQPADPFLFCVHHDDAYPAGNDALGPAASLAGRDLGQDFAGQDGWRMYHGLTVPGFPAHPHRGFETVTIVRRGLVDHSDSLGATARFGQGDAQWLTAGGGIVHAEMFPLVEAGKNNPLELFQIWLNLPAADKMVPPHFRMLWSHTIPTWQGRDAAGKASSVTLVAGQLDGLRAPPPPPHSWASRAEADVAIWCIRIAPGATFTLPAAAGASTKRTAFFFAGGSLRVDGELVDRHAALDLRGDAPCTLQAGEDAGEHELLLLQGRPIGEPVVQYGPFVMSSRAQIQQAMADYQRTRFGGWPWKSEAPVHARAEGRFAKHADGQVERVEGEGAATSGAT